MLTVLGGLAEFERSLIVARTGEGRKRAKDRGVKFGRPRKLTPHQRQEALQRLAAGETQTDVAHGCSTSVPARSHDWQHHPLSCTSRSASEARPRLIKRLGRASSIDHPPSSSG
jgi:DNA invertase Pin-like site-specific DNA recombinase